MNIKKHVLKLLCIVCAILPGGDTCALTDKLLGSRVIDFSATDL